MIAVVAAEYQKLCEDHDALIRMGQGYGDFDPLGKVAFLDALEAVEERWAIFYGRFALTGELSAEFAEQTDRFLTQMGLDAEV